MRWMLLVLVLALMPVGAWGEVVRVAFEGRITEVDSSKTSAFAVGERVYGELRYDLSPENSWTYTTRFIEQDNNPYCDSCNNVDDEFVFQQAIPLGTLSFYSESGFTHQQSNFLFTGPAAASGPLQNLATGRNVPWFHVVELSLLPTFISTENNPFSSTPNYQTGNPWVNLVLEGFDWSSIPYDIGPNGRVFIPLERFPTPTELEGPFTGEIGFDELFRDSIGLMQSDPAVQFEITSIRLVPEPSTLTLALFVTLTAAIRRRR